MIFGDIAGLNLAKIYIILKAALVTFLLLIFCYWDTSVAKVLYNSMGSALSKACSGA